MVRLTTVTILETHVYAQFAMASCDHFIAHALRFAVCLDASEIFFVSWRSLRLNLRMRCSEVRSTWIRSYKRNTEQQ